VCVVTFFYVVCVFFRFFFLLYRGVIRINGLLYNKSKSNKLRLCSLGARARQRRKRPVMWSRSPSQRRGGKLYGARPRGVVTISGVKYTKSASGNVLKRDKGMCWSDLWAFVVCVCVYLGIFVCLIVCVNMRDIVCARLHIPMCVLLCGGYHYCVLDFTITSSILCVHRFFCSVRHFINSLFCRSSNQDWGCCIQDGLWQKDS